MKPHYVSALALLAMIALAFGSVETSDLGTDHADAEFNSPPPTTIRDSTDPDVALANSDPVKVARMGLAVANQKLEEFKNNNPQPEPPVSVDRTWLAAKGDYTFHGRAIDFQDDIVTLRATEGGRIVEMPITRLDEKHHDEIAELFNDYQQAAFSWQDDRKKLEEAVKKRQETLEKAERQQIAEENVKQRQDMIDDQFSSWDGSHKNLTSYIKERMHDKYSYQHVSTSYVDEGFHLIVTTEFNGKNAFGAIRRHRATAMVSITGKVLEFEFSKKPVWQLE